ncbi:hypothetical protein PR202_gb12099 [Eleusine coracana subsp. coracana]|uniref:Rx N-terminal domain-containing protein n=1 Tax=Eleusine coracana subsp. coracana TaxID=191504 RepID=A0AAV5END7_ELECO|nr:hypothetical protein PR202_gb12099 [Eleusine coracana subsp. coracana]
MADMFSSAVVQETVSQILSGLIQNFEEKEELNTNRNLERLEMAQIRLEAALETSYKWQITDASLLRWRRKLKRAAQECDDTLHKCKQRILEDEQIEQEVRSTFLPNRIARATKSFVFSVFSGNNNKLSNSTIQRFEWFATGASEFLRFIELGGTPRCHIPSYSLVKNLFAGMELHHIVWGNGYPLFQLWLLPYSTAEHGKEARLIFIQKDGDRPEGNIYFSIVLQLSESTDIVGVAIKCLYLFAPHFKCTVENIRKELTQLYTQNCTWVPSIYLCQKEHWDNLHCLVSQLFRPNPLCCKQHDEHELRRISNQCIVGSSDVSLEPVTEVVLQTFMSKDITSLQEAPYLKVGISFAPHGSLKGILPANRSSAIVAVVGKEQYCLHTDVTLEQLKEIMLPKAIDYFLQNADATHYQMIWKSEHGSAYIQFEKVSMSARRTSGGGRKRKLLQEQNQGLGNWARNISHLLDLWGAHMPIRLRSFYVDSLRKEKEGQFTAQQRYPYHII